MNDSEISKPLKRAIDDIDDNRVRSYIDYQQAQLESLKKIFKTESIKNQVFQLIFSGIDFQNVMDAILGYLHEIFPGVIRCVISQNQNKYHASSEFIFTFGENVEEFSYLDDQIRKLLETRRHILISDTSKNREIKYSQNKLYPDAIAAFPIKESNGNQDLGFVWIAVDKPCDFSREKIKPVFELVEVMAIAINYFLEKQEKDIYSDIYRSVNELVVEPVMVLSSKYEPIWSNQSAKQLFLNIRSEVSGAGKENKNEQFIRENIKENKEEFILKIGDRSFMVKIFYISTLESEKIYLLRFIDNTNGVRDNELLSLILYMIKSNLKFSMDQLQGLVMLLSTQGITNDIQNESLKRINQEILNVNTRLGEFLTLERFHNLEKVIFEKTETKEIIDKALQVIYPKANQKGITISTMTSNTMILVDRVLIIQALINLIDNAIKYSHQAGEILISESSINNQWRIEIKDNGKGMSAIDVKRLLSKAAFTVSEMKGFNIAKEVVKLHAGEIDIESSLGEGTRVRVDIPIISQ